jgi:phosphatidate cytidylyltransferase
MADVVANLIHAPLAQVIAAVWCCLALASLIVAFISRRKEPGSSSELQDRTRTWWWIISILTIVVILGPNAAVIAIAIISFLAFREFHSVVPVRRVDRAILALAYLAIPIQFYFAWSRYFSMFAIFIPVYAFATFSAATVFVGETKGFIRSNATLVWALMLTVYNISHLAFLAKLPLKVETAAGGMGLLLFVLILVQFNDVAQFVWGRLFGRARIVPKVSPGKTWEGFLGGAVTTTGLAMLLAPLLTPFSIGPAAAIGLLLAIMGFVGDITLSAVKRDLGIKDAGALLPGHGGILDRVDSLTFAAPIAFHVIRFFYGAP